MHRSDCVLPFALRRGTRPFKAVTAVLLSLPGLIILLLLLDRHREDKRAAEASLRRARAALGSGALQSWPCALDLPRKTTLGDLLRQLGKDEGARSKVTKGKAPQQVLLYNRRVLPNFWTPAPPLPPAPATQESLWSRIKGFLLSLGERQPRSQQHSQQPQEQHGRVAVAAQPVAGPKAPAAAAHATRNESRGLGPPMSSLASIVATLWDVKAQHGGILKTSVAGLRYRQRVAHLHDGWACELVFNPGRASKPMNLPDADAASLPVRLPFDPAKFHFEKASALDLLFLYEPPAMEGSGEHRALEAAAAAAAAAAGAGANTSHPLACSSRPAGRSTAVLVNPYPIGELSGVIAPFVLERRPQDLNGAEEALRIALAFAADASRAAAMAPASSSGAAAGAPAEAGERRSGIRVGYNSIGACASVNALHFQFWRFDLSPDGLLPLERAPRVLVQVPVGSEGGEEEAGEDEEEKAAAASAKDGVELYKIDGGYPLRALMLRAPTIPLLARAASKCVDALLERDVPHSLLLDGQRVFVVPRQKHAKPLPFAVSPGFPEASGLLLVMADQDFEDEQKLNADLVWKLWSEDMAVGPETFAELVEACMWI